MRSKLTSPTLSSKCGKTYYGLYLIKIPISVGTSCTSFFILEQIMFGHTFSQYNVKSPAAALPQCLSPFCLVWLLFQTTQRREKSWRAVILSPARCQSGFQLVSGPGPLIAWGGGGWVCLSKVHCLVLSKWTDGAAQFLTKSWNRSSLLHT